MDVTKNSAAAIDRSPPKSYTQRLHTLYPLPLLQSLSSLGKYGSPDRRWTESEPHRA
jgi:hypothetical protein